MSIFAGKTLMITGGTGSFYGAQNEAYMSRSAEKWGEVCVSMS